MGTNHRHETLIRETYRAPRQDPPFAMTKMVTRCPQCGTSFRITAAQLQTARGAVRCGACLHIFRAQEHLVGSSAPEAPSALVRKPATKPSAKPAPAAKAPTSGSVQKRADTSPDDAEDTPDSTLNNQGLPFDQAQIDAESDALDDDDFLISDDLDNPLGTDDDDALADTSRHSTSSLFEREFKIPEEEPIDSADESWAMNLLAEEDQDDDELHVAPVDEKTPATSSEQAIQTPSEPVATPEPEVTDSPADSGIHFHLAASSEEDDEGYAGDRMHAYDSERTALLMGIDPEPVEMEWTPTGDRKRKLMWAGLALLGLLVLTAQVAWLQFERLSRLEPYRSFYGAICPLLDCELPVLRDPSQIRAVNLVVRSHPTVDDALSVDAILLNTAPFEQPFPDLILEFSDLEGGILAQRRFQPSEYLSGELAGRTLIPRNQHVHVTLELVDPGPNAVSYRAYIAQ